MAQKTVNPIIIQKINNPNGTVEINEYSILQVIGSGGQSICFQAINEHSKQVFALKKIKKNLENSQIDKIQSEINIHKTLNHPNIVRFYNTFEFENEHYIRLQCCKNKTLKELIDSQKLTPENIQFYAYKITQGLNYLRKNHIIHGDLKPENILIGKNGQPKICDFGFSTKLNCDHDTLMKYRGTIQYMAPEYFFESANNIQYSYGVDVWALGITFYELFTGQMLFEYQKRDRSFNLRKHEIKPNLLQLSKFIDLQIPDPAKNLIRIMLHMNDANRPSPEQVLHHPYFTQIHDCSEEFKIREKLKSEDTQDCISDSDESDGSNMEIYISSCSSITVLPKSTNYSNSRSLYFEDDDVIDEQEDLQSVYVKQCVSNSSEFQIYYELSNGCTGVVFNDLSQVVSFCGSGSFGFLTKRQRYEKVNSITTFSLSLYPEELDNQVKQLQILTGLYHQHLLNKENVPMCLKNYWDGMEIIWKFIESWKETEQFHVFTLNDGFGHMVLKEKSELIEIDQESTLKDSPTTQNKLTLKQLEISKIPQFSLKGKQNLKKQQVIRYNQQPFKNQTSN